MPFLGRDHDKGYQIRSYSFNDRTLQSQTHTAPYPLFSIIYSLWVNGKTSMGQTPIFRLQSDGYYHNLRHVDRNLSKRLRRANIGCLPAMDCRVAVMFITESSRRDKKKNQSIILWIIRGRRELAMRLSSHKITRPLACPLPITIITIRGSLGRGRTEWTYIRGEMKD